jgi:hypothetical protein
MPRLLDMFFARDDNSATSQFYQHITRDIVGNKVHQPAWQVPHETTNHGHCPQSHDYELNNINYIPHSARVFFVFYIIAKVRFLQLL